MAEKRSRRRGRGSLLPYMTKAGERWKFQIYVPVDPSDDSQGMKRLTRGGYASMEEADEALSEALLKRKNDEQFHGSVPTLKKYGEEWLDALTLQPSTMLGYRRQFQNYIVPHLGNRPLDKIIGPSIGKLYKLLRERGGKDGAPLSANTVNKTSITLAAILDSAMEDGLINKNPARLKKIVKAPTGRDIRAEREEMVTWTAEQLRAFLDWNRDKYKDELFPLWFTLARTGMRRGEVLALQWRDIDFQSGKISIRRAADSAAKGETKVTKSGKARVIDADAQLLAELKKLKALRGTLSLDLARPNAFLFSYDDGRLRDPAVVSNRWKRRTTAAGKVIEDLPHIPLHGLRHTHATLLMMLGESPKVVQERLGHASIQITLDLYSHVMPTMQKAAADKFSALLDQA